jgi:hypothetical protein
MGHCLLWAVFFKIYRSSHNLSATLFHGESYVTIFTKLDWASFWAIFSQTHLVALFSGEPVIGRYHYLIMNIE